VARARGKNGILVGSCAQDRPFHRHAFVAGLFAIYVGFRVRENSFRVYNLPSGKEQKRNKPEGTNRKTYPLLRARKHTNIQTHTHLDGGALTLLVLLFAVIGDIGLVIGFAFGAVLFAIYVAKGQRQQF
jgi:hypothetical protein